MLAPHPHGNRQQRRADAAWRRLTLKRSVSVLRLAEGLAQASDRCLISRNEARRRLQAEVTRRYGKHHASIMQSLLRAAAP